MKKECIKIDDYFALDGDYEIEKIDIENYDYNSKK
jgi:hypothetical protein